MDRRPDDSYIHQEASDGTIGSMNMAMTKRRKTRSGGRIRGSK